MKTYNSIEELDQFVLAWRIGQPESEGVSVWIPRHIRLEVVKKLQGKGYGVEYKGKPGIGIELQEVVVTFQVQ